MSTQENIYAYTRNQVLAAQANRVAGGNEGLALAISVEPLSAAAKTALEKSFAAIGFDADESTFARLDGLSPEEAFDVVEGIDPLVLVATDEQAAALYSQAIRQDFPLMKKVRVFGREARAFPHLNDMMEDGKDKQAVWHLLKSLV